MPAVRGRKQAMVESFRASTPRRIDKAPNVELKPGEARFTGPRELEVGLAHGEGLRLAAGRVFLNTGSRPADPPIPGLDRVRALNSTTIMDLEQLPEHLIVLGGGYVGLEFGQMFRRLGSRVTIAHQGDHLLNREDPDVAEAVAEMLLEDGVEVRLSSTVVRVESGEDGGVRAVVHSAAGDETIDGSHLLVAVGRTPNTEALNLQAAGVRTDEKGFVVVNERLETGVPGIYALGDVKGGPAFTHVSYDDYRVIRTNLLQGGEATTRDRLVPYVVYTDPQLGRVGLSEEEARRQGKNVRVARMPMNYVSRAVEVGESRGLMKAIVDAESGTVLGAAVLGVEGGELMSMLQVAIMGRLPYTALRDAVFAHPTLAESLNNLFASLDK
jgi:pyruvate/2-oxoglutarate dehydrogenase complex dihydrolipoamide dehydrogenase (E3) component